MVLLSLAACGASESDATDALKKDGFTDVKITGKTAEGFQFSAKDDKGASCTGTISIKKSLGSTSTQKTSMCSSAQ
jgi:hypothetical protein